MAAALALVALAGGCGDEGTRATEADAFVDSIGVNVHMSYTDTAYRDRAGVGAALRDLGVRHVRDGIVIGRADQYAALRALARRGIRADLILGDPRGRFGTGSLADQLRTLKEELAGVAETVEGPNEYDMAGDPAWPRTLRAYQERLYDEVKGDPELTRLPVVGPSVVDVPAWARVGDLSRALDHGNLHPYPAGAAPSARRVREHMRLAARGSGSKPFFVTETGYHNAVAARPPAQPGVSEPAAAAYLPRLLLENFTLGIERTFLYELADEKPDPAGRDPERHFGLVRNDLTRKPAFAAVRNTIARLRDPGDDFEPERLDFSVKPGEAVSRLLLQKRDGTFYLALWRTDGVAPLRAEVRFEGGADRVRVYRPSRSGAAVSSSTDAGSVTVELGADAVVLEVDEG